RRFHHRVDLRRIADRELVHRSLAPERPNFGRDFLGRLGFPVIGQRDVRPGTRELTADGLADAAAATDDEDCAFWKQCGTHFGNPRDSSSRRRFFIGLTLSSSSFGSSSPASSRSSHSFIWWAMSNRSYCAENWPPPPYVMTDSPSVA